MSFLCSAFLLTTENLTASVTILSLNKSMITRNIKLDANELRLLFTLEEVCEVAYYSSFKKL